MKIPDWLDDLEICMNATNATTNATGKRWNLGRNRYPVEPFFLDLLTKRLLA